MIVKARLPHSLSFRVSQLIDPRSGNRFKSGNKRRYGFWLTKCDSIITRMRIITYRRTAVRLYAWDICIITFSRTAVRLYLQICQICISRTVVRLMTQQSRTTMRLYNGCGIFDA